MGLLSLTDLQQNDAATPDLFNTRFDAIIAVLNGNVDNLNLKDNAVTTPKIADQNVTTAKIADANVTTAKLADANVTFAKTTGIWWEELGRTTLAVAGDSLTVSSFSARKYLRILVDIQASTALIVSIRFNNDSAANYALRFVNPSTLTGTALSGTSLNNFANSTSASTPLFIAADIVNRADAPKFGKYSVVGGSTAAGTAPDFLEVYGKWTNTTAQITRIDILNTGAGDFAIGSEVVVLGHN